MLWHNEDAGPSALFCYQNWNCMGKESGKEYTYSFISDICPCITDSLCCTLELTWHCKSTILQKKLDLLIFEKWKYVTDFIKNIDYIIKRQFIKYLLQANIN